MKSHHKHIYLDLFRNAGALFIGYNNKMFYVMIQMFQVCCGESLQITLDP